METTSTTLTPNITDTVTYTITSEYNNNVLSSYNYVMKLLRLALFPFIMIANGTILIAIIKYKALHSYTNAFICSLTLADFLIGTVFLPLLTITILEGDDIYMNRTFCLFVTGPYFYTLYLQMISLLLISFDRFLFILYPFRYSTWINWTTVTITILSVWFVPMVGPVMFMTTWNK